MAIDPGFFWRGMVIGFSIAAPVGPIGVLCIRRTLAQGRAAGLVSGLGAATADAVYGCVAGFGLTSISAFLLGQELALRVIGGLFLLYLGLRTALAKPVSAGATPEGTALTGAFASTLALTLTNPMTIVSFLWIFAGLGLCPHTDYGSAGWMVLGVFLGSALWWLFLSGGVSLVRERFDARAMRWVNRLSGGIIVIFGIVALLKIKL